MKWPLSAFFALVTVAIIVATLLPLTHSDQWWIRALDFPRVHIGIVAVLAALWGVAIRPRALAVPIVLLLGCAAYQGVRIFPYPPSFPIPLSSRILRSPVRPSIDARLCQRTADRRSLKNAPPDYPPSSLAPPIPETL